MPAAVVMLMLSTTAVSGAGRATPAERLAPAAETGAEIRVTTGRTLAEHSFLLMELMRAEAGEAAERDAIRAALEDNTAELRTAIGAVSDEATAAAFVTSWMDQSDLLVQYTVAEIAGNTTSASATSLELDEAGATLAAILAEANPRLASDQVADALDAHLDQMRRVAGDPVAAYAAEREAFAQMFALGDLLARAAIEEHPDRYADDRVVFSPAADLRVAVDRLLGEHLLLAGEAMRTGLVGSPASEPSRISLEANTKDLAGAMGFVYGAGADEAFGELWRAHIDAYLDYIDGVHTNDAAEKERTLGILRAYGPRFGAFIASATEQLPADAVADLIHHHVEALIGQVNAFAAADYPRSFSTVREAYGHMYVVGDALAAAIAAQFPDRFPALAPLPGTFTEALPQGDRSRGMLILAVSVLALGCLLRILAGRPQRA